MASKQNTSKSTSAKSAVKVGLVAFNAEQEYFDELVSGIKSARDAFEDQDITLEIRGISYHEKEQLQAIDDLVKKGVCGIVLTPFNTEAVREKLLELKKKKIAVVTVNSEIEGAEVLSYVGVDAYKSGQVAGGLLKLISSKPAEIIIITGSNSIMGHSERVRGFVDTVKRGEGEVIIEQICECLDDNYKAYEQVQKLAQLYPTADTFFFAAGGVYGGCKGIYQMTIRKNFNVITFDDLPANRAFMENGTIDASVCQNCNEQGYRSMYTLCDYLFNNVEPEEKQYMDVVIKIKECL